jgi:hypothetical protein
MASNLPVIGKWQSGQFSAFSAQAREDAGMNHGQLAGETTHNRSFRTHAGYLSGFRTLAAGSRFSAREKFLPDLAHRSILAYSGNIRAAPVGVDEATVRSCLHRGWGTETILSTTAELSLDADLIRLSLA